MSTSADYQPAATATVPSTPTPPLVGLPVERVPGQWVDLDDGDAQDGYSAPSGPQLVASPVPLIAAVQFGGTVTNAFTETLGIGASLTIGERGNPRPRTTALGLFVPTGTFGAVLALLADGQADAPANGAALPVGAGQLAPLWLPLRRAVIRNISAAPLTVAIYWIGYETL